MFSSKIYFILICNFQLVPAGVKEEAKRKHY